MSPQSDSQKAWYERNRERVLKKMKLYREEHLDAMREYQRRFYEKNPTKKKEYSRRYHANKHGTTLAELLVMQEGQCAICDRPATVVDHDHNCCPGRYGCKACVRGALCTYCNTILGLAGDNARILKRATSYLENSQRRKNTRYPRLR